MKVNVVPLSCHVCGNAEPDINVISAFTIFVIAMCTFVTLSSTQCP